MMRTTTLVIAVCLLGLTGCAARQAETPATQDDPLRPLRPGESPQVRVLEQARQFVALSSPTVNRSMGEPIRVSMPVRSMAEETLWLEYRYEFFNQAGEPMQPTMDWS